MEKEDKRRICVLIPCLNEAPNIELIVKAIDEVFCAEDRYIHEILFIDNCSTDGTRERIRELACRTRHLRAIFNSRNFGHIRSPYYGLLQTDADACIAMAADFQDPPTLIPSFLRSWESGNKIVVGIKTQSEESFLMFAVRSAYYRLIGRIATVDLMQHFTGFGLYDRSVIEILKRIDDPYPYFRGLISEIGFHVDRIPFHQPRRKRGITKNNFFTLYDMAMLGVVNHSRIPLRLATLLGFFMSAASLLVALTYLLAKLLFWDRFALGIAPVLIGVFFFGAVQLFFVGIIGEYVGAILTQVQRRPLVIEQERINLPPASTVIRNQGG